MKALVSIHDVMPETMTEVEGIIRRFLDYGIHRYSLLIVPGRDWQAEQINRLRKWFTEGAEPVAHGWLHETRPRRMFHRLHSLLLSRNVAEHLDLEPSEIIQLMKKSKDWFRANELPAPETYVPPAWALGSLSRKEISALPYKCIEVTRGIMFPDRHENFHLRPLPLCGFEADTALRKAILNGWNRFQLAQAKRKNLPLRISIHPNDFQLRCARQLESLLSRSLEPVVFADMFKEGGHPARSSIF